MRRMGVFDFLRKKRDGEIDLEGLGIKDESEVQQSSDDEGFKPAFVERAEFQSSSGISGNDVQLILTKLDLINQRLENMDRKLQVIEKAAKES